LALEILVLDSDEEPELALLELPPDAALVSKPAPVSEEAATGAADFKGLGLLEMGLNYLGEAAESHASDSPVESSARQLRDDFGRGEGFVECLCRVDRLGQRNQPVNQCAIANELLAGTPESGGVDLVEGSSQVTVVDMRPGGGGGNDGTIRLSSTYRVACAPPSP
jgi:hypothetical protein